MEKIESFVSNYELWYFRFQLGEACGLWVAPSWTATVPIQTRWSRTLFSPISSWTGLNHAAAQPRQGQGVAGIKQRVLTARSPTFWFCISLTQALRAGDIHQVRHGVLLKVVFHPIDGFYWVLQVGSMFSNVGSAAIHVSQRLHAQWWQRCFATAWELKRWQRCGDRLSQLQGRIKFPPVTSFTVGGVTHKLPMRSIGPPEAISTFCQKKVFSSIWVASQHRSTEK